MLDRYKNIESYDPIRKNDHYTFFCPGCQADRRGSRTAYIYDSSGTAHCSNKDKCGWRQTLVRPRALPADFLPVNQDDYWREFLSRRRLLGASAGAEMGVTPSGGLAIPVRDFNGDYCGYIARRPDDKQPRYLTNLLKPISEIGGYGVHQIKEAGDGWNLVLVEGILDAVAASLVLPQAVGIAALTSGFSARAVEILLRSLPQLVLLGQDNDKAGQEGILKSIRHIWNYRPSQNIAILRYPTGIKDMSELWENEAVELLQELTPREWLPDHWSKSDQANTAFEQYCINLFPKLSCEQLADLTGEPGDYIQELREQSEKKNKFQSAAKRIEQASEEARAALASLDTKRATELLRSVPPLEETEELLPCSVWESNYLKADRRFGLFVRSLPGLNTLLQGFRGLVLIGGVPNLGKTILTVQIILDLLERYEEYVCIFLTLDQTPEEIYAGVRSLRDLSTSRSTLDRLYLVNKIPASGGLGEGLGNLIDKVEKQTKKRIVMVIDYMQRIPLPGERKYSDIQTDQYYINAMKELRNKMFPIPVIVVTALSKVGFGAKPGLESFKGSTSIVYDADQVLLLQENQEKNEFEHAWANGKSYQIAHVLKARNGARGKVKLVNYFKERRYEEEE